MGKLKNGRNGVISYSIRTSILTLLACLPTTSAFAADAAVKFAKFLGAVSAIEEACPTYYVRTDATMGNHLSPGDYQYALSREADENKKAITIVAKLGCEAAAKEAVKLTGLSYFEVWEIKEP